MQSTVIQQGWLTLFTLIQAGIDIVHLRIKSKTIAVREQSHLSVILNHTTYCSKGCLDTKLACWAHDPTETICKFKLQ